MIPANAAQTVIAMTEQLESLGKRVSARADTPLARLASLSSLAIAPAGGDSEYTPDAATIEAESRIEAVDTPNLSQHDSVMDSMITDLTQIVGQHLTFAKNTVRPMVKAYVEMASQTLAAYPDATTYNPQVIKLDLPEVALLQQVESEARKFSDTLYLPMSTALNLPLEVDAVALLKTGSEAVDQAVEAWLAARGPEFFKNVYAVVFCSGAPDVSASPDNLFANKETGHEAEVAAFLMATNLLDNVPEGAAYSLNEYRTAVGTVVEQTGLRMCVAYGDREHDIQMSLLVKSYDKDHVWVFAPVYEKWQEEGYSPAIFFGNMLLDRPNLFLPAIMEDAPLCTQRWERENLFLTTTIRNRQFVAAKEALSFCAQKLVSDNIQTCFGEVLKGQELTLQTPMIAEALARVEDYITTLDQDQIKNLWKIAVEVVACTIFSYSSAGLILLGIERATNENADIEANEAALLATIEYVCGYIVDQMEMRAL